MKRATRLVLALGLSLMAVTAAQAGVFGVPTNIHSDGRLCTGLNAPAGGGCTAAAINPPGWFILNGDNAAAGGDVVHQMRLFIEVTGTTLDVKIFDAGSSGLRDVADADADTVYTLLNPAGATIATVTQVGVEAVVVENRLARLQAATLVAANAGAPLVVTPGLYELRIVTEADTGTDSQTNAFGVDIRDGTGNHYNVFTIGQSTAQASSFIAGRWTTAGGTPIAEVSAPMPLFAHVERGCSVIPSNFHAESSGPATLVDALAQSTSLTLSTTTAVAQTLTVETTAAVNVDATNYGMWPLTHNVGTGSGGNVVDWRVADYRGWLTAPGAAPGAPSAAIRTYLPNGYAPAGGNANAVAPSEPAVRATYFVVSGPNVPEVGTATRVRINAALDNPGPGQISNVILQIPIPATGAAFVAGSALATLNGVTTLCAEPGGVPGLLAGSTTSLQCTMTAPVPVGSVAALGVEVDITPAALGLLNITGRPALAVSGITRAGTTATATTVNPHWLAIGDSVTIAGGSVPGYNITATIIATPLPNTFTYAVPGVGGTSTGTITATENGGDRSVVALYTPAYGALTRSENAGPICQLTGNAIVPVNLGITKTGAPNPVAAGSNITYTITANNPAGLNAAPSASMVDVIPTGTTFQSLAVPAGWACTTPAVGASGTVSCTRASFPANTTSIFTLVVQVAAFTTDATVISNTATVSSAGFETNTANNSASASTRVTAPRPTCATGVAGSPASITGIVNSYFPGAANAANGATSITVGPRLGAAADIVPGDLLLVIQMQDAAIDSTNTVAYGGGTNGTTALNNVGRYEYVMATNTVGAAGGTINLATALTRGPYTNAAATLTQGQRRFQVVRVPQYVTTTLTSGLTARPWDGAVGGILAVDVVGTLALGGATVDVSGLGFRAGQGRTLAGGTGTDTDYRNPAAQTLHGSKGEGIAGTPQYLWSVAGGALDTTIDGYPNGSSARGRPGNAGGGGTDDDPTGNTQNSGGGGGGNGGAGGRGGNAWNTQATLGGLGGAAFAVAADRLVLGGGGGAGSRNNSSGTMGSGGAGGGMVFLRAGSMTGTATINADGQAGVDTLQDGSGGGGAGGSILALAVSGGTAGLTANARGGDGGDAWPLQAPGGTPGERHGPGGGGGGGAVFISTGAPAPNVAFGAAGTTTTAVDPFGAQVGFVGSAAISGTLNTTIPAACSVPGTADLAVSKSTPAGTVPAGNDITYTVQVQNLGPSTALNPVLSESVPTNTTFQSLSVPVGWSCTGVPVIGGTGSFTCTTASLASAASATFTYVVRVNLGTAAGTVISNTASASSVTADTNSTNNAASALKNVDPPPALVTRATIAGLRVDPEGRVRFATGSQRRTSHFDLYASNDRLHASDLQQVNRDAVEAPVADSRAPLLYDVTTDPIAARYLYIAETEVGGKRNLMGPFLVGDGRLEAAYDRVERRLAAAGSEETFSRSGQRARILSSRERRADNKSFHDAAERHRAWKEARRERRRGRQGDIDGVKIEISRPGRVEITRDQLAAQGLPGNVSLRAVKVTSFGQAVAATVSEDGASLSFETTSLHTTYTGENVYVLSWQSRTPNPRVPLSVVDPTPAGITRISKRAIYYVYTEGMDPWAWDILYGSTWPASWDPQAGTFDLPGLVPSTLPVPFELKFAGGTDHTHIVEGWLNGQPLGEVQFQGQGIATLRGVVEGLQATGNRLTFSYRTAEGDPASFAVLSHLDLALPQGTAETAVIEDVSPFSTDLPNFAKVDTLVVTHGDFENAAERYASLKTAEGLKVAVVDVERAYDAFSAGVAEAEAVRALIKAAARESRGLRYVVLIGDDTADPQDFLGLGEVSFIPSVYGAEWVASENGYADVDGDGRPDLAIGRLPVRTVEEADALVDKIAGQAAALSAGAGRHLFAVDNGPGPTNSFRGEAQVVAAQLPSDSMISLADIGAGIVAARNSLAAGFAGGSMVHYFGHGGREIWADENLLDVDAVDSLTGAGSVILTWGCQAQDYQYFFGYSVNEALVLKPQGGALASFGPAGVTDQAEQALLYGAFYERLEKGGTLGEIIRDAKAAALDGDPRARAVVEDFNLLGDPAILIAPPQAPPASANPRKKR